MAATSQKRKTKNHLRVERLRAELTAVADPSKVPDMRAYLKNQFDVLGVSTPQRKQAQRTCINDLSTVNGVGLIRFARLCWAQPEREFQYVATDALRRHKQALDETHLNAISKLITTKPWWDTVDALAVNIIGDLVSRYPSLNTYMDEWIRDEDIWLARTAILHQLKYKEHTNSSRLFAYVDQRTIGGQ